MGLKLKFIIVAIIISSFISMAQATWQGPTEIISGTWGNGSEQFGIMYQDTDDMLPIFTITSAGNIVVRDGINSRLKVYTSVGTSLAIIPYKTGGSYKDLTIADSYGFSGDFVGYGANSEFYYRADQKVYINYSPTGQLIKTYTTRPPELGVASQTPLGNGQYKITVTYPDRVWSYIGRGMEPPYIRDVYGNLYSTGGTQAIRWNFCGKELARLTMPEGITGDNYEEYGEAVVAPNGDVYTWKRTAAKYSIIKWTWVDDPNQPTGPDAPTNLAVAASTTGLYLTWTASPNDPGCVTGYEISRSDTSGGTLSVIATVDKGVLNYNDTTAAVGTTYYYKLRAKSGPDFSAYTNEASGGRQ